MSRTLLVTASLLCLLGLLQRGLWVGNGSIAEWRALDRQIAVVQDEITALTAENAAYTAEMHDLKHGFDAIEERARADMGMVAPGEVFYLLIREQAIATRPASPVRPVHEMAGDATVRPVSETAGDAVQPEDQREH